MSVVARKWKGVGFGTEAAVKSRATIVLSLFSTGADSCACATHTLPSINNAAAKSLFMVFPSEG